MFQLINMFYIAETIGADHLYINSRDFIPLGDRPKQVCGIHVFDKDTSQSPSGRIMTGAFFNPIVFGALMDGLTPDRRHEIAQCCVRPLLEYVEPKIDSVHPNDVVVHVRSGDIFEAEDRAAGSALGGQLYVQPPLSFYMLAIKHALGASPGAVHIVAENALNPIIIPLIQKLEASAQPVNVRLGQSLNDDLNWILAARKLVLSNGTIGIAASLISDVLEQAYFFRTDCTGTAHPIGYFLDKNRIDIHVAEDNDEA